MLCVCVEGGVCVVLCVCVYVAHVVCAGRVCVRCAPCVCVGCARRVCVWYVCVCGVHAVFVVCGGGMWGCVCCV